MAVQRESEIKITVGLDENRVAETILWEAEDGGLARQKAKALMMGVWSPDTDESLRIDLWTKDMTMDEMKRMIHTTFISMADVYERATDDNSLAADVRDFARYFGEKSEILKTPK